MKLFIGEYSDNWCGSEETFLVVAETEDAATKEFDDLANNHYHEIGSAEQDKEEFGEDEYSAYVCIEEFDPANDTHISVAYHCSEPYVVGWLAENCPNLEKLYKDG